MSNPMDKQLAMREAFADKMYCLQWHQLIPPQQAMVERAMQAAFMPALVEARDVMTRIAPYKDSIICYASTMAEHEPNRIAHDFDQTLARINAIIGDKK